MGCFESKEEDRREATQVRGCTDIFWLVIFALFLCVMIVIAGFGFIYGNPIRIINGYDSFGNTCGVKSNPKWKDIAASGKNTEDLKYVFFFDIKSWKKSLKLCVKECPREAINSAKELGRYAQKYNTSYCHYDFDTNKLPNVRDSDEKVFHYSGPCPKLSIAESKPILKRCAPLGQTKELYSVINSWDALQEALSDLYKTWHIILLLVGLSIVLSILMIGLLHYLTAIVSWLICILVVVASVGITAVLWWTYYDIKHNTQPEMSKLAEVLRNETGIYIIAILATIVMIVLCVIIYFMRSKFAGLAALFEEAGKCMYDLPGLVLPLFLTLLTLVLFICFWTTVVICISSSKVPVQKNVWELSDGGDGDSSLPFDGPIPNATEIISMRESLKTVKAVRFEKVVWRRPFLYFYFVALIWVSEFIFACQQLVLAGAVAYWYFNKPTDSPICDAMSKLVKYHLGSAAKGSFLITLFKIPRIILTYLYTKLKASGTQGSQCAECGLKCCMCCFWMLEKFMRYLNHNAYTVIAIESINFCPAAGVAWNAIWSNIVSVATINGIGDFILFLGKLSVAAICGFVGLLMLRGREDVNFYIVPVILATIFAFFIAHVVLSIYEIVVDTLFLCVYEDRTINGNTGRWKQSNLANLLGEEAVVAKNVEGQMQEVELTPINRQPFAAHA